MRRLLILVLPVLVLALSGCQTYDGVSWGERLAIGLEKGAAEQNQRNQRMRDALSNPVRSSSQNIDPFKRQFRLQRQQQTGNSTLCDYGGYPRKTLVVGRFESCPRTLTTR